MNDERTSAMSDDDLDARLAGYLSWQSDQLRDVPSAPEVAIRIAGGIVRPRHTVSPALAWAAVALALLLAGLAVFYAGLQDRDLVVAPIASATPTTGPSRVVAAPTPRPSLGPGACGTGRVEITAATAGDVPGAADEIDIPNGVRLAMALENEEQDGGAIVIAEPDGAEPRVVATFTGEELASPGAVQVVEWSADGSLLLVWAGMESLQEGPHCGNLWTVATDGSSAARITDNRQGEVADTSAFAPSGSTVAYAQAGVLHVVPPAGDPIQVDFGSCLNGPFPLQWSPDGTRILLICGGDDALVIVDIANATSRRVSLPAAALAGVWSADGASIVATMGDQVPGLAGGPLSVIEVDPRTGDFSVRLESEASTEWVLGTPSMSPDGRWLLVLGDGEGGTDFYRTYIVETATGETAIASFPLLTEFGLFEDNHVRRPTAIWLEGNDRVLVEREQALYEVDVGALSRTVVGAVPAQDFAWYPIPR